jgi:hypothetical protein
MLHVCPARIRAINPFKNKNKKCIYNSNQYKDTETQHLTALSQKPITQDNA